MDSLVLHTAIGLVFVFGTFAALVATLTEFVARYVGLRGEYLMRGIRSLVDGRSDFELPLADIFRRTALLPKAGEPKPMVADVLDVPVIASSADKAAMPSDAGNSKLTNQGRRNLPSYISARQFAGALFYVLTRDVSGNPSIEQIRQKVETLRNEHLRKSLLALLARAGDDIAAFRKSVEEWYDDHMARVSGWYKRHVRWISLGLGAVLVLAFNVNAVQIAQSLYTDQALRGSVVAAATDAARCQDADPATCLRQMREEIQRLRETGLPIGWGITPECAPPSRCGWLAEHGLADPVRGTRNDVMFFLLVALGWGLMVLALLPGARFWFDALGRLGSLRSTGPKPSSRA